MANNFSADKHSEISDKEILDTYKQMLEMSVVSNPRYFHQERAILLYGQVLKPKETERNGPDITKHPRFVEFEKIFDEVRKERYPQRPSRYKSVFLWPRRYKVDLFHFPRPHENNVPKIRERLMRDGGFGYAVSVSRGSNLFYGSNGLVGAIVSDIQHGEHYIDAKGIREWADIYWSSDMRRKKRVMPWNPMITDAVEVLAEGGTIKVVGLPQFELVD